MVDLLTRVMSILQSSFMTLHVSSGCVARDTLAAEKVEARSLLQQVLHSRHQTSEPVTSFRFKREGGWVRRSEMEELLSLDEDSGLEVVSSITTSQGTRILKMQETFQGRRVFCHLCLHHLRHHLQQIIISIIIIADNNADNHFNNLYHDHHAHHQYDCRRFNKGGGEGGEGAGTCVSLSSFSSSHAS